MPDFRPMSDPALPPRLVLDTNVWLDLLVFADPRCAALGAAIAEARVELLIDADCHAEWARVLTYPTLQLDATQRDRLCQRQRALCLWQPPPSSPLPPLPRCRDPDDQKFLQLALCGGAQRLLSRDQALLELDRRLRRRGLFGVQTPEAFALDATVHSAAADA